MRWRYKSPGPKRERNSARDFDVELAVDAREVPHDGARAARPLLQGIEDAALPALRAMVDPAAAGGEYYGPSGFVTMAGPPVKQRSSRRSRHVETARALWESCQALTGVEIT